MSNQITPSLIWRAFHNLGRNYYQAYSESERAAVIMTTDFLAYCAADPSLDPSESHDGFNLLTVFMANRFPSSLMGTHSMESIAMRLLDRGVDPFQNLDNVAAAPPVMHHKQPRPPLEKACPLTAAFASDVHGLVRAMLKLPSAPSCAKLESLRTKDGLPWLCDAIAKYKLGMARVLLEAGVGPDLRDRNNKTALFYCCNEQAVDLLLEFSADPSLRDSQNRLCMTAWSAFPHGIQMINKLRNHGLSEIATSSATNSGRLALVKGLSQALCRKRPVPQDPSDPYTTPRALILLGAMCLLTEGRAGCKHAPRIHKMLAAAKSDKGPCANAPWSTFENGLFAAAASCFLVYNDEPTDVLSMLGLSIPAQSSYRANDSLSVCKRSDDARGSLRASTKIAWDDMFVLIPQILDETEKWLRILGCKDQLVPSRIAKLTHALTVFAVREEQPAAYFTILDAALRFQSAYDKNEYCYAPVKEMFHLDAMSLSLADRLSQAKPTLPTWLYSLSTTYAAKLFQALFIHPSVPVITTASHKYAHPCVQALTTSMGLWDIMETATFLELSAAAIIKLEASQDTDALRPLISAISGARLKVRTNNSNRISSNRLRA